VLRFCAEGGPSRDSNVLGMLDSAEAVIRSKLEDGEQFVWSDRPRQGLLLQRTDALLIPFSLVWAGFAFFFEYEVMATHRFWLLQLWGVPFVLAGLYLVVGRFFTDAYVRGQTYYGLTDRRVIIARGSTTQSIPLSDLTGVAIAPRADKSGTIVLGAPGQPAPNALNAYFGSSRVHYPMFQMIPDAQSVYDQIEAQRKAATSNDGDPAM
jgi:hypothetical protein